MDQSQLELQLQVWKDLAVSKQMLIGAATSALKLDADCSMDELKEALTQAIEKGNSADSRIREAEERARNSVDEMEKRVRMSQLSQERAEEGREQAASALTEGKQSMAAERNSLHDEIKKLKAQLAEKEKAIKAINVSLADTPENVLKKMRTLKKQKLDESNARKIAEDEARNLRKENRQLEQDLEEQRGLAGHGATLAAGYSEIYQLCTDLHARLSESGEEELADLPEQITEAVAAFDSRDEKEKEKAKGEGKGGKKRNR